MKQDQKKTGPAILLLVLLTLVKGVLWSAAVPVGQAPDEPSHLALVQFIGEFGRLPGPEDRYQSDELAWVLHYVEFGELIFHKDVQQQFGAGEYGPGEPEILTLDRALSRSFEYQKISTAMHVPPLYHLLAVLGYRLAYWGSALTRIYAARLVSVLLLAALVLISYGMARDLFPKRREMWLTLPLVVSFQPMVTFLGAVVNSDILLFVLFSLMVWLSVRVLRRGLDWKHAVALGVTIGLGVLTKPMVLAAGLAVAIALLVDLARRRAEWKRLVLLSLFILLVAGLICGWSLVRNYQIQGRLMYNDPLRNPVLAARADPNPDLTVLEYWTGSYRHLLFNFTPRSYWGNFGWLDTPLPSSIYRVLYRVTAAAALGLGVYLIGLLRRRPVPWLELVLLGMLAAVSISLLPPVFWRGYSVARQTGFMESSYQGRYQLGAWLAQASLLVLGLVSLVPIKFQRIAHFVLRVGFIFLNLIALAALISRYYL